MCQNRLLKSDPKRIHSLLSTHLYSFLGKESKIVLELFSSSNTQQHEKWDCKAKNQTQHFFSRKVKICQAQFQLQKYFPVFSFLPVTAVLQRCYLVTDDREGNSVNKIPIPKIYWLKERLVSYSSYCWHDHRLEESCNLYIIWVKEVQLKDYISNCWWMFPATV